MSDEQDLIESPATAGRCARCDGPLPAPVEMLSAVHARDGEIMRACSVECLADLVADLTGHVTPTHRTIAGRRN